MSQYIDRKEAMKSYRPKAGTMSPGLKRAREPYRLKNALLGLSLAAFAVGVWAYSISAVRQDVFDDIDEEAEALGAKGSGAGAGVGVGVGVLAKAVEQRDVDADAGGAAGQVQTTPVVKTAGPPSISTSPTSTILDEVSKTRARGLLAHLDSRLPWLLDPQSKTLVWGAPPVDNVGKLGRRS